MLRLTEDGGEAVSVHVYKAGDRAMYQGEEVEIDHVADSPSGQWIGAKWVRGEERYGSLGCFAASIAPIARQPYKPDNTALTFAAEAAGVLESRFALPLLLPLLAHESPLVREGAVLGLAKHCAAPGVFEALEHLSETDPSPGVRSTAKGALEDDDALCSETPKTGEP